MLNNNYKKFVGGILKGNKTVELDSYYKTYNYGNMYYGTDSWSSNIDINKARLRVAGISVIVGSGDTEPTMQDIKLANKIGNLTYITSSMVEGTIDYTKFISVTYRNDTSDIITVREIGLAMAGIYIEVDKNNGFLGNALLGRIVLDAPVIMNPGDTYTFSYGIE